MKYYLKHLIYLSTQRRHLIPLGKNPFENNVGKEDFVGKDENAGLPAFSSFPTLFSKGFFLRGIECRLCVVKDK